MLSSPHLSFEVEGKLYITWQCRFSLTFSHVDLFLATKRSGFMDDLGTDVKDLLEHERDVLMHITPVDACT